MKKFFKKQNVSKSKLDKDSAINSANKGNVVFIDNDNKTSNDFKKANTIPNKNWFFLGIRFTKTRISVLSFLSIIAVILLVIGIVFSVLFESLANQFNTLQYNFANAFNLANTNIAGKPFNDFNDYSKIMGYDDSSYDASYVNVQNYGNFSINNSKFEQYASQTRTSPPADPNKRAISYQMSLMYLQENSFNLFGAYTSKFDEITNLLLQQKSVLKDFNAGKLLLGPKTDGNAGFIYDSKAITNEYLTANKPHDGAFQDWVRNNPLPAEGTPTAAMPVDIIGDMTSDLLGFLLGGPGFNDNYAAATRKYFVVPLQQELGLKLDNEGNADVDDDGNQIYAKNPNSALYNMIQDHKITKNTLIWMLYNRILVNTSAALFRQAIFSPILYLSQALNSANGWFINGNDKNDSNILEADTALYAVYFTQMIYHAIDILLISTILDGLNYIMFREASYIYTHPLLWNTDKNWKILTAAEEGFDYYFRNFIYWTENNPGPITLYCRDKLYETFASTEYIDKNTDPNIKYDNYYQYLTATKSPLLNAKITPDVIWTNSNTKNMNQYLQEQLYEFNPETPASLQPIYGSYDYITNLEGCFEITQLIGLWYV